MNHEVIWNQLTTYYAALEVRIFFFLIKRQQKKRLLSWYRVRKYLTFWFPSGKYRWTRVLGRETIVRKFPSFSFDIEFRALNISFYSFHRFKSLRIWFDQKKKNPRFLEGYCGRLRSIDYRVPISISFFQIFPLMRTRVHGGISDFDPMRTSFKEIKKIIPIVWLTVRFNERFDQG